MKAFFFLFLAAFALAVSSCTETGKPASTSTEVNAKPAEQAAAAYACPMKCEGEKTYDKPGQCPVCKMDLVAASDIEAEEHDHPHDDSDHGHQH